MGTPSDAVAGRVREVRRKRGLSVAQLAQRCADLGMPELTDQAIYNLEKGRADRQGRRRRTVSVDELLVLAHALDVAPVHLLVPIDDDDRAYQVTPSRAEPAGAVRDWVRGAFALKGADLRDFRSEVPAAEFLDISPEQAAFWQERGRDITPGRFWVGNYYKGREQEGAGDDG